MGCALPQADGGMEVCRWIGLPIIDVANISSITLLAGSSCAKIVGFCSCLFCDLRANPWLSLAEAFECREMCRNIMTGWRRSHDSDARLATSNGRGASLSAGFGPIWKVGL